MRYLSAELDAHFGGEVTTLAVIWMIKRTDDFILGFTNHDVEFEFNGTTYEPMTNISSVEQGANGGIDNLDLDLPFQDGGVEKADVINGLYDGAALFVSMVNYKDLTMGSLNLLSGKLGQVGIIDNQAEIQFDSLSAGLEKNIMETATYECPAQLGDSRCKISVAEHTDTGAVDVVSDEVTFTCTGALSADDNHYQYGTLTFTSGNNNGKEIEVKKYTAATKTIEIVLPISFTIAPGDTFDVVAGCDGVWETCTTKFNNGYYFRGRPHIPGDDKLKTTPTQPRQTYSSDATQPEPIYYA